MADYKFPKYVEERVRYFDGQFLQDQDFIDEQKYHIDRLRRHNRYLHATGIIEGLTVDAGTKLVTVANGTALDGNGRLIVLSKDKPEEVSTSASTGEMVLVIQFNEEESRPTTEGSAGNSRFQTQPTLSLVAKNKIPSDAVVLAALNIGTGGAIDAEDVDTTVRVYSGLSLPGRADGKGPTLRAHSHTVAEFDGTLAVTDKLGIGTTNPNNKLDVEGDIRINNNDLFLRTGVDKNHGLGWYGGAKKFNGVNVDGPALYGYSGGVLGTMTGGQKHVLFWNKDGNVGIGTTAPDKKLHVENGELRVRANHNDETADIGTFFAKNLSQGIGIGYNRIEAIGGNENQDIWLIPKGSGKVRTSDLDIRGPSATTSVETKELVRLLRPGVSKVKNSNSVGFSVGSFETGSGGKARLDITLSGKPVKANGWGSIPEVNVMSLLANGNVGIGTKSCQLPVMA